MASIADSLSKNVINAQKFFSMIFTFLMCPYFENIALNNYLNIAYIKSSSLTDSSVNPEIYNDVIFKSTGGLGGLLSK